MRFLKLLRVLKLSSFKQKYEDLYYNDSVNIILGIVKILSIIMFFTHILACLFWMVGASTVSYEPLSWTTKFGLIDEDIFTQYVNSLYWAFTTMVTIGYGDISALNTTERLFCMCSMTIMAGVYAFTINEIGKKVKEYNRLSDHFKENMLYVGQWMEYHDLRQDLRG